MEAFYIVVLTIAAAVLIIILTTVGVAIRKANQDVKWPPTGGRCPDGWEEDVTTPSKCYLRSDMINSGNVTPESTGPSGVTTANGAKGYAFPENYNGWLVGNKWRECGSIDRIEGKILYADDKSNFSYFSAGDDIKIGSVTAVVASKDDTVKPAILTLTNDMQAPIVSFPVQYYGKRISVDFNKDKVYMGAGDESTKCLRKKWANDNKIEWDGISNYNKCD
jgi:hypothetical protein